MDIKTVVDFLLLTGAIQGFLYTVFVFIAKKRLVKTILYLSLTVLFLSFNNFRSFLVDNNYFYDVIWLYWLPIPWHVLIAPMFYGFLTNYLKVEDRVLNFVRLAVIIFSIEVIIRIFIIFVVLPISPNISDHNLEMYSTLEEIVNSVFSLFVVIKAWQLVFNKKYLYQDFLKYDSINWIKNILRLSLVVVLLWLLAVITYYIFENVMVYYPVKLMSSGLIYWLGYQGLFRFNALEDREKLRKKLNLSLIPKIKWQIDLIDNPTLLISEKHKQDFLNVNSYVIENNKFLDPNLSVSDITEALGMSASHFSKIINTCSDYHFPDYINSLRVAYSKNLLSDVTFNRYTVISIGLESGFNSKSTFYTAFKKFTNLTPTQFRKGKSS